MKSHFRTQFLGYFLSPKLGNTGFTLIELLVVILMIGILSAIALPTLLSRANKAKQVEAKLYVGAMNRGQQAYYLENTVFTESIDELGVGIRQQTENYLYKINIAPSNTVVTNNGISRKPALKSYAGVPYLNTIPSPDGTIGSVTITILCESPAAGEGTEQTMNLASCPTGWIPL